jgi:hypothetical protein
VPRFQVQTESLSAAAAQLGRAEASLGAAHAGLQSAAGAFDPVAGTGAAFAFLAFLDAARAAQAELQQATGGLARALDDAAAAYQLADQTAARSEAVGGP